MKGDGLVSTLPVPPLPPQDNVLKDAVKRYGTGKDSWKRVADALGGDRTDAECQSRWVKALNPSCVIKGPWTKEVRPLCCDRRPVCHCSPVRTPAPRPQEDTKVVELVRAHGPRKWSLIADHLPGRIGKQCRER